MIVVFGSINVDLIARVARIPAPGETLFGSSFVTAPGGKGANQALAARRAGADVALFGAVGRDGFATTARVNLDVSSVRCEGVATVAAPTGIALVNVADSGENAITVIPGANALARAAQVPDDVLTPAATLLLQLEVPHTEVERLARRAHERGARVILNAAPAVVLTDVLLRSVDVLLVNEHEAALLATELRLPQGPIAFADAVRARFTTTAVITLGARGALTTADGKCLTAVPPAVTAVDTTGAGDALAGAFAAALDRNSSLPRALAEGVAAGALACTQHGAQTALPDAAAIRAYAGQIESAIRYASLS